MNIDLETRSALDLRKTGVYPYAAHPTTDVWCASYALPGEEVKTWLPGAPCPRDLADYVRSGGAIHAWNAQFERIIWRDILTPRYGWPLPELEQWHCTAAAAAAMALPRSLGDAAAALGMEEQKDDGGRALMLRMARPRKPRKGEDPEALLWTDNPEKLRELIAYCEQDVRTERGIAEVVRELGPIEREIYLLDQRVNDRGVGIDLELVEAAERIVKTGTSRANREIAQITKGAATAVTKPADIQAWLEGEGVELDNLRKETVRDILAEGGLDEDTRAVLELRSETAKSSTAKLRSMQHASCDDGRARGLLLYHGASTGRWTGRLIQPQNFPRGDVKAPERFIEPVMAGDYDALAAVAPPLAIVSALLRAMIKAAPGHVLMAADYAQIEARVLAWLAGAHDLVHLFASGGKVYEEMAAYIYGKPVDQIGKDSHERQIGKNTVLGAGYGMGAKTFVDQVQAQTGVVIEQEEGQRAIDGYRRKYPRIPALWAALNRAAIKAVEFPGTVATAGLGGCIRFTIRGRFLWCVLPSGRPLAYADPELREMPVPWGGTRPTVTFMGVNSYSRKWERRKSYGGLWTENVVQAIARDLIAAAMYRLELGGYRPVLSVHDEVLCEPPQDHGSLEEMMSLMVKCPTWAKGLPVAVDGWRAERFKK